MDRFETIFKKKIQPFIENVKVDFIRSKIILLFSCILFALSFFSLSIPYVMVYIFPLQMISLLRFSLILAIPGMVYGINTMRKIDKKFKKTIMPEFATFIHPSLNYFPKDGIPITRIEEMRLFNMNNGSSYKGKDLFQGEIEGVEVSFSHINIKKFLISLKEKYARTIFNGHVYCFDFTHPESKGTTVIIPRSSIFGVRGLRRIKFPEFRSQNNFSIYSDDERMARALFTRNFMIKINQLSKKEGKKIRFAFQNGKMLVAISSSRDAFNLSFRTRLNKKTFKKFFDDAHKSTELIHHFQLNKYFWNK